MYEGAKPKTDLKPLESKVIGDCDKCKEKILSGEEVWSINEKIYCKRCLKEFRTTNAKDTYFYGD